VPRAATGGTCCADRFAAHTLRRQQRFKEKTPKSHSPGKCWFFLTALQLPSRPVHCWRAWLLSFGSFGAKSPGTIFWLAGQILVEKIESVFFLQNCAGQILGVIPDDLSSCLPTSS